MKRNQTDRLFLSFSLCGFVLMSVSFLLMPVDNMRMLPGLLFWSGFILGIVFQVILETRRRAFFARYKVKRTKFQKPRCGLLMFASNKIAVIVDNILVVSVVATVLVFVLTGGSSYLCFASIAVLLLSLCLHSVFNGRNYFHINNKNKIRQVLENKKESNSEKGEGKK